MIWFNWDDLWDWHVLLYGWHIWDCHSQKASITGFYCAFFTRKSILRFMWDAGISGKSRFGWIFHFQTQPSPGMVMGWRWLAVVDEDIGPWEVGAPLFSPGPKMFQHGMMMTGFWISKSRDSHPKLTIKHRVYSCMDHRKYRMVENGKKFGQVCHAGLMDSPRNKTVPKQSRYRWFQERVQFSTHQMLFKRFLPLQYLSRSSWSTVINSPFTATTAPKKPFSESNIAKNMPFSLMIFPLTPHVVRGFPKHIVNTEGYDPVSH